MNNAGSKKTASQNPEQHLKKVRDIYIELFQKLFSDRVTTQKRRIYHRIIKTIPHARLR